MFSNRYTESASNGRTKWTPGALSVVIHLALLLFLLQSPVSLQIPARSKSAYEQVVAGHEKEIVWYRFKDYLPDVSPRQQADRRLPLKAETKAKQAIVSAPKQAPKRQQMVLSAAPAIPNPKPVELANLLAVKMPDVTPPKPKAFTSPPDIVRPPARVAEPVPEPPSITARALPAPVLPQLPANVPRPMKRFTQPPLQVRNVPPKIVNPLPDAPDLAASFDSTLPETFHVPLSPARRPFKAPSAPSSATRGVARSIRTEAPPETTGGNLLGNNKALDFAVVGLNPTDKIAPPAASSPAEFAAGPVLRKEGATAAGESKGLSVPDIFVRGAKDAKPDLIARAYAPATSSENLRGAMRHSEINAESKAAPAPAKMNGATQVSSAPDPRFQGRDVFMMAIQMPNLTSYSGSWLLWYAERDAHQKGLGAVAPPVAYRKVDPKYVATAVEERIQGKVQLACVIKRDGHVAGVELIRGIDDRLNRSACEALSKWEFTPAMRNGEPVDVDVLVEIPFQLAPKVKGPY